MLHMVNRQGGTGQGSAGQEWCTRVVYPGGVVQQAVSSRLVIQPASLWKSPRKTHETPAGSPAG